MLRSTRVYWIRYLESTLPTDRRLLSFGWFSPNRASSERSAKNVRLACCLTATCFQNVRDLVWIREHSSILFTRLGHKDHIFVGPHVAWHSFLRLSDSFDPKGWWLGSWSWWLWKLFEVANCTFACGALGNRLWDLLILGVFVCLFACLLACLQQFECNIRGTAQLEWRDIWLSQHRDIRHQSSSFGQARSCVETAQEVALKLDLLVHYCCCGNWELLQQVSIM